MSVTSKALYLPCEVIAQIHVPGAREEKSFPLPSMSALDKDAVLHSSYATLAVPMTAKVDPFSGTR